MQTDPVYLNTVKTMKPALNGERFKMHSPSTSPQVAGHTNPYWLIGITHFSIFFGMTRNKNTAKFGFQIFSAWFLCPVMLGFYVPLCFTSPNYWGYNVKQIYLFFLMWNESPIVGTSIPTPVSLPFWLVVGPPLWKIWKSIGMMTFPINHQPVSLVFGVC